MIKFRPQSRNKIYSLKARRYGDKNNYNFVTREKWYPVGWKLNHIVISNIFYKLHYLACHAPNPIKLKYKKSYLNLRKKIFGAYSMSIRYTNKYSVHSWL